jgi:hypothetical protein
MTPAPDLRELVDTVRADAASDDPLDQLGTASVLADQLLDVSDAVLGHYVDRARRSGHSWTEISAALGVSKQAAHKRFARTLRRPDLDRFTDRARATMDVATVRARELGHTYVGTEHLLLGLLDDAESVAGQVLHGSGIDPAAVEELVLERAPRGDTRPYGPLPHTPRAAAVIEATARVAAALGHSYIGTEHLLLALYVEPVAATAPTDSAYRAGGGLAAEIMRELGLDRESAGGRVVEQLSGFTPR